MFCSGNRSRSCNLELQMANCNEKYFHVGCWFKVSACTADPKAVGTYRDIYGETHNHAGQNETECFKRAVAQWKYCGSHHNEQVTAIYGPTGDLALPICDECTFPSLSFLDESIFIFRGSRDNFSILFHISMKIVSAKRIAPDGMPRFAISIVSDSRDLKRIRLSGAAVLNYVIDILFHKGFRFLPVVSIIHIQAV